MHTDFHVDRTNGCAVIAIFMFYSAMEWPSCKGIFLFLIFFFLPRIELMSVLSLAKISRSIQEL